MSPTRIAFVITELEAGGAERALVQLVTHLPRVEWEPRVYCFGPPGPLVETLREHLIPVHCYGARSSMAAARVLWQLTADLRKFEPVILQSFLFHANLLGRFAAWFAGVPVVLSGLRVADRRSRIYAWLERASSPLVTLNICVSKGVANYYANELGFDRAKLVVIPNGVEFEKFQKTVPIDTAPFGIPAGAKVMLTIGRLERQKGIDILLRAAAEVLREAPDVHFVIIGAGPDLENLRRQAAALGITSSVHFVGRSENVPGWLATSYAYVLSSRWEGMPNVVLEAMAAGKPVIATKVEGIDELVRKGETGWTVPPENPGALAEVIVRILRQEQVVLEAGKRSQTLIVKDFTIETMWRAYARVYQQLASSVRSTPLDDVSRKNS